MLVFLDMSAAFDTIGHALLLQRLPEGYDIIGTALKWFTCFLTNRTRSAIIGSSHSRSLSKRNILNVCIWFIIIHNLHTTLRWYYNNDTDCQIYANYNELYVSLGSQRYVIYNTEHSRHSCVCCLLLFHYIIMVLWLSRMDQMSA